MERTFPIFNEPKKVPPVPKWYWNREANNDWRREMSNDTFLRTLKNSRLNGDPTANPYYGVANSAAPKFSPAWLGELDNTPEETGLRDILGRYLWMFGDYGPKVRIAKPFIPGRAGEYNALTDTVKVAPGNVSDNVVAHELAHAMDYKMGVPQGFMGYSQNREGRASYLTPLMMRDAGADPYHLAVAGNYTEGPYHTYWDGLWGQEVQPPLISGMRRLGR